VAIILATIFALDTLKLVPWGWAESILDVAASLGIAVLAIFLMAPVTAMFAGFFLDRVAGLVEKRHYPGDLPGRELPASAALKTSFEFGLLVLLVNILLLPSFFFGIGAIAMLAGNAYLLSREYFELAAMRHMEPAEAKALRKENSPRIFLAGLVPALLALVPIVNIVVPLFSTAYFIHLFKQVRASSA
jgi:CysZ protein